MSSAHTPAERMNKMKITYRFANGETSVVEVSEEVGQVIMTSRRKEHADDEKQRYYCSCSLDGLDYEGMAFVDESNPEQEVVENYDKQRFWKAFNQLNEIQKRRLRLRAEGLSLDEIAAIEGVSKPTIYESLNYAKKKFEKLF